MFAGSAEELIKQELQAVAEGVAASVFSSSTSELNKHSPEANLSGEFQNNNNANMQSGVEVEVMGQNGFVCLHSFMFVTLRLLIYHLNF